MDFSDGNIQSNAAACLERLIITMNLDHLTATQKASLSDCLGRFKLWAGNTGALHFGRSSLDARLGKSPISEEVLNLLRDLAESLKYLLTPVDNLDEDQPEDVAEIVNDIVDSVAMTITNLLKLSSLIRHNPGRNPWKRIMALPEWDARPMVDNIVQKWPKLKSNDHLAQRLGRANARRLQFFRYREKHAEKLSRPLRDDAKTLADTESTRPTTYAGKEYTTPYQYQEAVTDDTGSDTTFATTLGKDADSTITIPPPPDGHEEHSVECSLCRTIITVKTKRAWKKHVYRDLRPYVCTFSVCDFEIFDSRHEWIQHEIEEHRAHLTCPICPKALIGKGTLRRHLQNAHTERQHSDTDLNALCYNALQSAIIRTSPSCPFCYGWIDDLSGKPNRLPSSDIQFSSSLLIATAKQLGKHIGRHMEQASLFALPRINERDQQENSNTSDKSTLSNDDIEPSINVDYTAQKNPLPTSNDASERQQKNSDHSISSTCKCRVETIEYLYQSGRSIRQPYYHLCERSDGKTPCDGAKYYELGTRSISDLPPGSMSMDPVVTSKVGAESLHGSTSKSPNAKKHKCGYCGSEFTRHHNLKSHLLLHSQEKPYSCIICDQKFRRLHDLKRHVKLHSTGQEPVRCPKCGRAFAREDVLRRHSRVSGGCAGRRDAESEQNSYGIGGDGIMDGVVADDSDDQKSHDRLSRLMTQVTKEAPRDQTPRPAIVHSISHTTTPVPPVLSKGANDAGIKNAGNNDSSSGGDSYYPSLPFRSRSPSPNDHHNPTTLQNTDRDLLLGIPTSRTSGVISSSEGMWVSEGMRRAHQDDTYDRTVGKTDKHTEGISQLQIERSSPRYGVARSSTEMYHYPLEKKDRNIQAARAYQDEVEGRAVDAKNNLAESMGQLQFESPSPTSPRRGRQSPSQASHMDSRSRSRVSTSIGRDTTESSVMRITMDGGRIVLEGDTEGRHIKFQTSEDSQPSVSISSPTSPTRTQEKRDHSDTGQRERVRQRAHAS